MSVEPLSQTTGYVRLEVRNCPRCGFDYPRVPKRGRPPTLCPSCRGVRPASPVQIDPLPGPRSHGGDARSRMDATSPGYRLAARAATLSAAVRHAAAALRVGRGAEAQAVLDAAIAEQL